MKKTFIAFYDKLIWGIIAGIMWPSALIILIKGNFSDLDWAIKNVHWVVIYAACVAFPTLMVTSQRMIIDLEKDKVTLLYLINFRTNQRDIHTNWIIYPSQIETIEVVRLTKEEKKKYTSAKFWFNKYLKITFKYCNCKYVYVSHYSNKQIKAIIKLLTTKIDTR